MPSIPRIQRQVAPNTFDPIGSFGRGYGLGQVLEKDRDLAQERTRQEQARNYFAPAVSGDTGAMTELAQRSPQMADLAFKLQEKISTANDPKFLQVTEKQMKAAGLMALAGKKVPPDVYNEKVRKPLSQMMGFDIGGVENADQIAQIFGGASNTAASKLNEVQSANIGPGGVTGVVTKGGEFKLLQPTPEEAEIIRKSEERGVDIQQRRAQARGLGTGTAKIADKALDQTEKLRSNNLKLKKVIAEVKGGAETGPLANRLPSFRAATRRLIQIKNELGLDVVGSVTFGALSEGELNLAMDTALPTGLQGPELVKWAQDKINAQEKLADYMEDQAVFLSKPGNSAADWLVKARQSRAQQPTGQSQVIKFDRQGNRIQ